MTQLWQNALRSAESTRLADYFPRGEMRGFKKYIPGIRLHRTRLTTHDSSERHRPAMIGNDARKGVHQAGLIIADDGQYESGHPRRLQRHCKANLSKCSSGASIEVRA